MYRSRPWILAALFASGLAGLMHEVVWAKLLADMIGSTSAAHAVVLAVFMGGLALGALILGKRSDANQNPIRVYVILEILIGLYGVALPWIARGASSLYERLAGDSFESPGGTLTARVLVAALVIAFPAICMGGTLPVLARALVRRVGDTRREVAWLYAVNNIGAVLGSGLAGFVLLPTWGIWASLIAASVLNLVAAVVARFAPQAQAMAPAAAEDSFVAPTYTRGVYRLTLIALLLAGFAAMGYEVIYLRIIALAMGSSAYSFTLMLMAFITGIGVGSWVVGRATVRRPLLWLGASQLAVVATMLATTVLAERLPYYVGSLRVALQHNASGFEIFLLAQGLLVFAVLCVPTICLGMGFPLVAQIQARDGDAIGSTVGSTYAWNTVGNVLGTVLTSQLLLPSVGLERALLVNVALHLAAGLVLIALAREGLPALRTATAVATLLAIGVYAAGGRGWATTLNLLHDHLRLREGPESAPTPYDQEHHATTSFENFKKRHVMDLAYWTDGTYLAEDPDVTVFAGRRNKFAALYLNGKGDASTGQLEMINQVLIGHVPMFLAPHAKDAMVIGYGSGVTAGSALTHDLRSLDLVEISKGVLGADVMFAKFNRDVLRDPRVRVVRDDARTVLRTASKTYDVIISQPSNPWIAGIGALFTVEFFEEVKARLNPGGIFCYWFHQYEQSDESVELMMRTLHQVFPHAWSFFANPFGDVIAIASRERLEPDFAAMEELFESDRVRQDLARIAILQLSTLLSFGAISDTRFADTFGPGPVNTDDHQLLENLGVRNLFWGRDTRKLTDFEGFVALPDGSSDSLLDRYLAWRREQGAVVGARELTPSARMVIGLFAAPGEAEHRLARMLRARAEAAPADVAPGPTPARGGMPDFARMDFVEAVNRATNVLALGEQETAKALYRRALEIEPGHETPTRELVTGLLNEGRLEEAVTLAEDSAAKRPDDVGAQLVLATLYMQLEQHDKAKLVYERVCASHDHPGALAQLAGFAELAEDWPRATKLYERALAAMTEDEPTRWVPALRLTLLYARAPETAPRAQAMLDEALKRQPDQPQLLELRKQIYGF